MSEQLSMAVAWDEADQHRASPSKSTGKWSDELVARLKELWAEGVSCSGIGNVLKAEFGVYFSRNSVIGKVHRLGLPGRATVPKEGRPRTSKLYPDRIFKPYRKGERKPPTPVDQPPTVEVIPLKLSLFELTATTCRYPYGEPGDKDFFFCGHPVQGESSYCPQHHHICHHNHPWGNERPDVKYRMLKRATRTQGMSQYSVIPPEAA